MRAAAALNQAQHGFHFLYVNLEFNICRAVSMMSCVTIQDVRNRANKFFSVNKSLDSSEKSGLKSGQITGSTLFWISACLGSHQPSLFSTSSWIPLQVIGEQVLGFIFFWSRCNKDPLLYLTLVLLSWICHLHQTQRAKDAARLVISDTSMLLKQMMEFVWPILQLLWCLMGQAHEWVQ